MYKRVYQIPEVPEVLTKEQPPELAGKYVPG
jgi:hypothetical protein